MTAQQPSAPPGWYPQPDGGQRYWDGESWTQHLASGPQLRRRKPWYLRWWVILLGCLGVLLGIVVALAVVAALFATGGGTTVTPPSKPSAYRPIGAHDFALLAKDPQSHVGERYILYGVVTQFDSATGDADMLVDTSATPHRDSFEYDTNTMVSAADPSLLANVVQDDHVEMYVQVLGSTSYDTQIGGNTTVPHVAVGIVEVTSSR